MSETKAKMKVMGIDPGYNTVGYGIIEGSGNRNDNKCTLYGIIQPDEDWPRRLDIIYDEIRDIVKEYNPDELAVEDVFHAKNAKTSLKLGHVRGILILAGLRESIEIFEYTPLDVKKSVVGYGRAEKSQVQQMVKRTLALKEKPTPYDASDALAVGLCHSYARKMNKAIGEGPQ